MPGKYTEKSTNIEIKTQLFGRAFLITKLFQRFGHDYSNFIRKFVAKTDMKKLLTLLLGLLGFASGCSGQHDSIKTVSATEFAEIIKSDSSHSCGCQDG